ncbi:helix-turn-helix transcriptional regulator [Yersinia pseudotuberculosis]|uniref:helix-turn-helix transcriptional regulator n=1 Tax=Yersinia pseudotuberculosis TaxID=633 RepID=UPI001F364269|nr:helix-turn-helix transcriptional regulator [Yersinia pseudotuberculosis]MCF1165452.1 helix-turn-helix transcriptional regulator [Yersinia pseudotuberculosis]
MKSNEKVTQLMKKIYPSLTPKEAECLFWTCLNLTKKEVGRRLSISENTVKYHLKSVSCKQEHPSMRDIKTAFLANVVVYALLDACQGMEGDTHPAE